MMDFSYKVLFLKIALLIVLNLGVNLCKAQVNVVEVGESLEDYILENHVESIENMIHQLASSKAFIEQFVLEEEKHTVDGESVKRKDVKLGEDIDINVYHISEHQTFTMVLVPISIYSKAIYDTLLFSAIEVTDTWIEREFPYDDYHIDSVKSAILSMKNHELLADHLYSQTLKRARTDVGRVKVNLNETYISASTIHEHIGHLSKEERELVRSHWGLLKKAFAHDVNLNVELNIYVFGFNDLEVKCKNKNGDFVYKITPSNIFQRHEFIED
ncbi:MAG: hypothetical protein OCD76_14275 [Reichenbachiella sp.]